MRYYQISCFLCFCFSLLYEIKAKSDKECSKTICYPTAGDLLIGRDSMLRASSTCGLEGPEEYCVVTLSDRGRDSKCATCDSRHPYNSFSSPDSHRIVNVVSRLPQNSDRWWQSNNGIHNASIEVEFVTEFQFIFTQLRFKTYRPAAMYIERSKDYGLTWQKSAYFSDNCARYFPNIPERKRNDISEVTCTSEFSSISPSEGGTVLFVATPSDLHTNDENWVEKKNEITAITNLRVQFVRLHTFGDAKIDNNPSILKKYHYAVSEWIIRGRCSCYGHASQCKPKNGEIELKEKVYGVCVCQHNTIGPNCERCKDFYNDTPWMPAENNRPNECKRCECNNHSSSCHFNSVIYHLSGRKSGGKCDNCMHNTEGIHCHQCASGYYRNPDVNISSVDTCLKCKCDSFGSKVPGLCNQENEADQNIIAGSCACKQNVGGFYCDRCKVGFWNFDKNDEKGCTECTCLMNGTINNEGCDQRTGHCLCKEFVDGKQCNICKDGYYNISSSNPQGCTACKCSNQGSLDLEKCDRSSGQCNCKQGYTGTFCDTIKDGYFTRTPKHGLKYNKHMQMELPPVSESGLYNFIITFDTQQVAIVDNYVAILSIDHRIKSSCSAYEDTIYIRKDTKNHIVPNKCLTKNLIIVLNVFLVVDPTDGAKGPAIIDVKVIPNLALNSSETKRLLEECLKYPLNSMPSRCNFILPRSSEISSKGDPLTCQCNVTGSTSHICNKEGGQCHCLPNVEGRQCNQCKTNSYGFDARGCKNCSCEPKGSMNLQCALDTGKCMCRNSVEGRHCNYCKSGFWRFPYCESCKCNSMADVCDQKTGQCLNCRGNTVGFNCEKCIIGYYGNPRKNIPCKKCACPGLSLNLNHSTQCSLIANTTNYVCACKPGYKGQFCDECDMNFYGNPRSKNGQCKACQCSFNIDRTVPDSCNVRTGECKKCLYNTAGTDCEKCAVGYFGNGVSRSCKRCVCNQIGTNLQSPEVCNHITGQCPCLPNVIGQQCDQCQSTFYNMSSGSGCTSCQCDSRNGALNETCNHLTGQCPCRVSRGGRQCDKCEDGYWGNPRLMHGCQVCLCNNNGSIFNQCDRNNGDCRCKPGIVGKYCDKCARGTDGKMPNCTSCGDCWKQWDQIIEQLSVSLKYDIVNGTVDSAFTPGLPKQMLIKLRNMEKILANIPNNLGSLNEHFRKEINKLKDRWRSILITQFNSTEYDLVALSTSITQLRENVANMQIKNFGGAYSIIEKSLRSLLKSVNDTLKLEKTIENMKIRILDQEQKLNEVNLNKLNSKTKDLTNLEDTLKKNLLIFNKLTCNSGSNSDLTSCTDVCGGIGCPPNNCSRTGLVHEQCLEVDAATFFNAISKNVDTKNGSISNSFRPQHDLTKKLIQTITKTEDEVKSATSLIKVTDNGINSKYNRSQLLLDKLKITINISTSEHDFKKLLDTILDFKLIKHEQEIKKFEDEIRQKNQQLNDKVDDIMRKSKTNRNDCDSLKRKSQETKERAANLLKSIKDLEDNNQIILKMQSDAKNIILNLNQNKSQIKIIQNQIIKTLLETESDHSTIDKILIFLKTLNEKIENSLEKIQKKLELLDNNSVNIKKKLENLKLSVVNVIQKRNSLRENTRKSADKKDEKQDKFQDKINKLKEKIESSRKKLENAKLKAWNKQIELKDISQNIERKLEYISSLEYEIYTKSEFQISCLP